MIRTLVLFVLELVYCGCILEDELTLESCGLKSGAMVHVLKKRESDTSSLPKYISEDNILQLASAFKSFKENPALRSALNVSIKLISCNVCNTS